VIEKTLPFLNQIGVKKITFIYCERSQNNFKLDFERFKKIIINSNQQCGRVHLMEFCLEKNLEKVISKNQNLSVLDFGGSSDFSNVEKVLVGCEGGFSDREKELLKNQKKIAFSTKNILKSETAVVAVASKLLI
jgi:16S rRNA (uracil1498-N3)-methyltransferase